jgi:putative hydrolase of the HAD superfamily
LLNGALTSAEFGAAKPAAAIFTAALELAGATAAAALHVGDSFEEDVIGARGAGIEPLLLVREPGPLLSPAGDPPDPELLRGVRTIASLAELAPGAA